MNWALSIRRVLVNCLGVKPIKALWSLGQVLIEPVFYYLFRWLLPHSIYSYKIFKSRAR